MKKLKLLLTGLLLAVAFGASANAQTPSTVSPWSTFINTTAPDIGTIAGTEKFGLAIGNGQARYATAVEIQAFLAGTSGHKFPYLDGTNTWSATQAFAALSASGALTFTGLGAGTQVSCLGLDAGNHVVLNAAACGSGTQSLANTHIFVGNGSNVATDVALSGDCTIANTGAITCLRVNGTLLGTAATQNTGTSGANVPLMNGANTWSATQAFAALTASGALTFSGLSAGTQVSCLGLDSGNHVVLNAAACGSGGTGLNQLTGDVTAGPGSGSQAATIVAGAVSATKMGSGAAATNVGTLGGDLNGSTLPNPTISAGAVSNSKRANMNANTWSGNATGSSAAPSDNSFPDCPDTGGNHLNKAAGAAITCGTSGSGGGVASLATNSNNLIITPSNGTGAVQIDTTTVTRDNSANNDPLVTGDGGKLVRENNTAATTVLNATIAQAGTTGFGNGWGTAVICVGIGQCSITPTTSTINTASSITFSQYQTAFIQSDGSNYTAILVNTPTVANALTAHAGGNQSSALQLTATLNRIQTVANANDSVKLPPSYATECITVVNGATPNSMQVFGLGSDTINDVASGTGVAQAAITAALYCSPVAGKWYAITGGGSGGTGLNQLTGDVTAGPGTGSQIATIANNAVTNAKSAQMAGNTWKGVAGSSTANASDNAWPDCPDSTGNHLNKAAGSGVTCGTSTGNTQVTPGAGIASSRTGSQSAGGTVYADASYFPMYMGGCTLSNDSSTPNTVIDSAACAATSDDSTVLMKLAAVVKSANATWALGNAAGCLDSNSGSTISASTWYDYYEIERSDTGVVDALCVKLAANGATPALPTNYDKKRRLGAFKTDASFHILAFIQDGNIFWWGAPTIDSAVSNLSTTATLVTLNTPPGVKTMPICRFTTTGTAPVAVLLTSPDEADSLPTTTTPSSAAPGFDQLYATSNGGLENATCPMMSTDTSSRIRTRASASSTSLSVITRGYVD